MDKEALILKLNWVDNCKKLNASIETVLSRTLWFQGSAD